MSQKNEQDAVDALNRFLSLDPETVSLVFNSRYLAKNGAALEADPTLVPGEHEGKTTLGPLGIINGIFGARIAAVYEDGGIIVRFEIKDARP